MNEQYKRLAKVALQHIQHGMNHALSCVFRTSRTCEVSGAMPRFHVDADKEDRFPILYNFTVDCDGRKAQLSLQWWIDTRKDEIAAATAAEIAEDKTYNSGDATKQRYLSIARAMFKEVAANETRDDEEFSRILERCGIDENELKEEGSASGTTEALKRKPRKSS